MRIALTMLVLCDPLMTLIRSLSVFFFYCTDSNVIECHIHHPGDSTICKEKYDLVTISY